MLERREVSARELLDAHLERIDAINPSVNAIVAMDRDVAQITAASIDDRRANGDSVGPLAGLVTAHKDLTDTADHVTTYGSPVFAGYRPEADSLLVRRVKAAGAIAVGKTNTPEFGIGSHTFNPVYGTTRNPWDLSRTAGGSSGGAAAALATGMVAIADGGDMGGSLRNPAAWNNVVGFRASAGLVPTIRPGVARATFGVDGAMGRSVEDLMLLLSVIGAPDARDPLNRGVQPPASPGAVNRPIRVAYSPTLGGLPVEASVADVIADYVTRLEALDWSVEHAEPDLDGADECFEAIRSYVHANGLANRVGPRIGETKAAVQEEFERGHAMSAMEVARAHSTLGVLWRRTVEFFTGFDLLVAPVTQLSPFSADIEYPTSVDGVPGERYLDWMRSCCRITALGVPAMSLPAGFDSDGLPVGVQLIGAPNGDLDLLAMAAVLEQQVAIPARRPAIVAGP